MIIKVDGVRGGVYVGKAGDVRGTKRVVVDEAGEEVGGLVQRVSVNPSSSSAVGARGTSPAPQESVGSSMLSSGEAGRQVTREALRFLFSDDGIVFREFLLDEVSQAVDAISRDAIRELFLQTGLPKTFVPRVFKALAPKLNDKDRSVVDSLTKLLSFLLKENGGDISGTVGGMNTGVGGSGGVSALLTFTNKPENRRKIIELLPVIREFAPNMRDFGRQIVARLVEKGASRAIKASTDFIFALPEQKTQVNVERQSALSRVPSQGSSSSKRSGENVVELGGFGYRATGRGR